MKYYNKLKFYWKDNKIIMVKYFFHIIKCGLLKLVRIKQEQKNEKKFQEFIKNKKEIVLEVPYNNHNKTNMILPTNDRGLTRDLIINTIREPTETEIFINTIKPNMNIIDIGANLGYYVLLEGLLTKGNIYAIEPNPNTFKYLKRNIEFNKLKNVELFNIGIGERKEVIPFYISKKWNWSRFVDKGEDIIETKQIEVNNLNNLFLGKGIDVVRMDVEGFELNILKGMTKLMKENPNLIIILEFHAGKFDTNHKKEFINFLKDNNLIIKSLSESRRYKKMNIKKNFNINKIINLNINCCMILKRK